MNVLSSAAYIVGMLGVLGGGYTWDLHQREVVHDKIVAESDRRSIDSELQRTNLEIKFLLEVRERRPLNADESDRLDYLRSLRAVLIEQLKERS